jgi:ferredoxin--NADP+ reductase
VVIGTGNVALDVARILLGDVDALARTDISDVALDALRTSGIREVVLLGRRGPETAAFSRGEFLALRDLSDVRLVVDGTPEVRRALAATTRDGTTPGSASHAALLAEADVETIDWSAPPPADQRRIVFRFCSPTEALFGSDRVDAVRTGGTTIPTGLVLRAAGYHGRPLPDLPFDDATGTVPNDGGRVLDPSSGSPVPGAYVTGWIKRGPSGGIGTNRADAQQTVDALLDDAAAGRLPQPQRSSRSFGRLLRSRVETVVDTRAAAAIDAAERDAGTRANRPRVKFPSVDEMLAAGRRGSLLR